MRTEGWYKERDEYIRRALVEDRDWTDGDSLLLSIRLTLQRRDCSAADKCAELDRLIAQRIQARAEEYATAQQRLTQRKGGS